MSPPCTALVEKMANPTEKDKPQTNCKIVPSWLLQKGREAVC